MQEETCKEIRTIFVSLSNSECIHRLHQDLEMTEKEKRAWSAFMHVIFDFLAKNKVKNYQKNVRLTI